MLEKQKSSNIKRQLIIILGSLLLSVLSVSSVGATAKTITAIIIDFLLSEESTFGAQRVSESERPSRAWLSAFEGISAVPLSRSLQDAVDNCPLNTYCVIEIDQLVLTETVFINRSNIKLIGKTNNSITFSGTGSILFIESGTTNIILEDLNIDGRINGVEVERDPDIYAIYLYGSTIQNILIKNNYIQYLDGKEGAHGIAALGTGNTHTSAIANLIIDGNQLNNLRTGFSESIVVNGNVSNWEIINNTVSAVNNIAIDAIGGEGTSPTQTLNGRVVPGDFDAARFGFIQNNTVTNMSTLTNPSYGSVHSFAGGIYIDGGRDIVISDNVVTDTPWAFEIGAENCVNTSNITLENNQSSQSHFGDLLMGGYASTGYLVDQTINCDPLSSQDELEGHGYVSNITVKSNDFNSSGFLNLLIDLSNRILDSVIVQTGVDAVNTNGVVTGDENSIRTSE